MFGALGLTGVACSGGDATPTRTRVAALDATQTPWIIYLPVTVTPGPATATLEATSTPSAPQATAVPPTKVVPTTRPHTAVPKPPTAPPESPTPAPPTATALPSCGQAYQVTKLTFPENGAKREAHSGSGAGRTIQFKWDAVASYQMDPHIGYRVNISTKRNSVALYISHNAYIQENVAILNQQSTWGLTQGDDATVTWSVDVIRATGEFNDTGDDQQPPEGTVSACGPTSPSFTIELVVVG